VLYYRYRLVVGIAAESSSAEIWRTGDFGFGIAVAKNWVGLRRRWSLKEDQVCV
jgi:hypothetical protein